MRIDEFEARMTEVLRTTRWRSAFARAVGRQSRSLGKWDEVPAWAALILKFLEETPRQLWPEEFKKFAGRRSIPRKG